MNAPSLALDPSLTPEQQHQVVVERINAMLRLNQWMGGQVPFVQQMLFLTLPQREILYGGSTKGGKSSAILMAALQYVQVPGYNALILHRTFTDLNKGDALIPRFREWTDGKGVRWDDENHTGVFPSGAKVAFGFVDTEGAGRRFKGANYQFIGWEELTEQPTDVDYRYLFSRLARSKDPENPLSHVPIRVRATTNPDGPGQPWVKLRWGLGHDENGVPLRNPRPDSRLFIPSTLDQNPHVDHETIETALEELDPVKYAQLRHGNWDVSATGDLFFPERIRVLPEAPTLGVIKRVRSWDKAGTEGGGKYTVGVLYSRVARGMYGVEYIVEDVVRGQWSSERRDWMIRQTAARDGREVEVLIEQEPGSGGQQSAEITIKDLAGYWVRALKPTGEKVTRARPFSSQVNAYNVGMVRGSWNGAYLDELRAAPKGVYMDQIDASSQAHNELALLAQVPLPRAVGYAPILEGMRID